MTRPLPNPVRIPPRYVERIWGARDLRPWFGTFDSPVGEVWFDAGNLLAKFIFTTEALSVQVHPDDAYARTHEKGTNGKTEMWYVLRAEPGAKIGLGFREKLDAVQLRAAALDGSIERLLAWHAAAPGDVYFVPAGTVHAIGAGLTICEIQQPSDVTYRLYDYGRPRELHLDKAVAVAEAVPHPGRTAPRPLAAPDGHLLVECPHFSTEHWSVSGSWICPSDSVVLFLEGSCSLGHAGEVFQCPPGCSLVTETRLRFLRAYVPPQ